VVLFALARIILRLATGPFETPFAFAFRLAHQVRALSFVLTPGTFLATSSKPFRTFIDINTFLAVALVASLALAFEGAIGVGASGMGVAVVGLFLAFVDLFAAVVASVAW